jgi:hypothetical protein
METDPAKPLLDMQMLLLLVGALEEMRNALVTVSLAMKDMVSETPSDARDDVMAGVERYLDQIRTASKKRCE